MGRAARRFGLGAAVAAVALSAVLACSSFGGTSSPAETTDGAAEGATPVPPSSGDAGGDAALSDADCSWFCDDFDRDPWPGPGWNTKKDYAGGTIDLTTEVAQSPPRALRVVLPADSGTIAEGSIPRSHFGGVGGVHCEVSVLFEIVGSDVAGIVSLGFKTDSGDHFVSLVADNGDTRVDVNEDNKLDFSLPALPVGTWTRIGVEYRLGTATRVTYDGVRVNDLSLSPAADAGATTITTSTITVGSGRNSGGDHGEWRIDYDDVACAITP